ncbi:MAG: porin family protein [Dokdonella sp.]|uniref:outer membrane protein n=1 Tax=Dokdonella sp. TaxID=2291710 RepID=UPI0025BEDD45|nr:porin family protein [Dokdonella sp.]MBX3701261.1 porin family protein [Dokdonella sp.]MCW5578892.1 porin family protein [Dokdonella sp.]
MKNMLFATALAAASFLALPAAHADNTSGFFINGNVGQSNFDKHGYDDTDTGYGANIGYRWALAPNFLLGVEGGYANIGSFDARTGNGALGKAELKGWNVGANAHFNLTDNWYLSGRAGWFRGDMRGGYFSGTTPVYVNDTSNKWYAGAGFGYDFSNNVSVGLNYDYYKANKGGLTLNPSLVSVSAEYRF